MKIIDCFMYFDEDMVLDIRLNILSKFVSKFVICEANFNHNGTKFCVAGGDTTIRLFNIESA